jgi:thiamine biosynthesis protein ThiI
MNKISELSIEILKNFNNKNTKFAIRASRVGNHKFTSQDIANKIGKDIVNTLNLNVDLSNPTVELFIEIRNEKTYIYTKKIKAVGGMPLGSQNKTLALINSPESILAAWYIMRRGCKVNFIIFNKSISSMINSFLSDWNLDSIINSININFDTTNNFYKILNNIILKENYNAVVTGHNLYDNIHDALDDIHKIKKNIDILILSPLISMNKNEIISKCREIGLSS